MARRPTSVKKTGDPEVIVDLVLRDGVFFLVLENIADRSLRDIQVRFRRKIIGMGGAINIAALPVWSVVPFMPPGKRIEVVVDRDEVALRLNTPGQNSVSVTYTDGDGVTWSGQMALDFGAYQNFPEMRIR